MDNILVIEPKEFFNFYDKPLNATEGENPWFYKETDDEFILVILQAPIVVVTRVTKESILQNLEDKSEENISEELQRWREGHLRFAIPFKKFGGVLE